MDVQGVEVARLQAKDAQAFRSLIERLQQPMIGYLHRFVGDHEVALDLAQDTFLQVYKEIAKTSSDLALDAWIYRIATNYALQYLNRRRLRQMVRFSFLSNDGGEEDLFTSAHGEIYPLSLSMPGPSVEDQAELRILVADAFSLLKPQDAACIQLHYSDGLTYEQIGRIVAITPEAVRKRVARGIEKLREIFDKSAI